MAGRRRLNREIVPAHALTRQRAGRQVRHVLRCRHAALVDVARLVLDAIQAVTHKPTVARGNVVHMAEVAERERRAETHGDVLTPNQERLEPLLASPEQLALFGVDVGAAVVQQLLQFRQHVDQARIRQQADVLGELRELESGRSRVALVDRASSRRPMPIRGAAYGGRGRSANCPTARAAIRADPIRLTA